MGWFNKPKDVNTSLIVTPIWGLGWQNAEVVGESHYGKELRGLMPREFDENGQEVIAEVLLCREPDNRFDRNAIAVRATTGTVGYIPKEDAARYAPVLDALAANGRVAQTTARVWGYMRHDWETDREVFVGSVRIALPEPHMLFPSNLPPQDPHVLLPFGSAIQVTGEESHRANLAPWLNTHGESWVYATLHPVVEATPRTSKTLAEVRIEGLPVGRLTPKMSQDMLPAVDYLAERGRMTCVKAIVKGNTLKSDVVLHTARAGELDTDWFSQVEQVTGASVVTSQVAVVNAASESPLSPAMPYGDAPPPPALPPANWYPDPRGIKRLRYWDGAQWTEHTAD